MDLNCTCLLKYNLYDLHVCYTIWFEYMSCGHVNESCSFIFIIRILRTFLFYFYYSPFLRLFICQCYGSFKFRTWKTYVLNGFGLRIELMSRWIFSSQVTQLFQSIHVCMCTAIFWTGFVAEMKNFIVFTSSYRRQRLWVTEWTKNKKKATEL